MWNNSRSIPSVDRYLKINRCVVVTRMIRKCISQKKYFKEKKFIRKFKQLFRIWISGSFSLFFLTNELECTRADI